MDISGRLLSPQELLQANQAAREGVKQQPAHVPTPLKGSVSQLYTQITGQAYTPSTPAGNALPKISLDTPSPAAPAKIYERSPHHNPKAFVPHYSITAYHESGIYRTAEDPYAVGAITNPNKSDDLGGKTYGTYQFESFVYRNGDKRSAQAVENSTLMRFLKSDKNPFGPELLTIARSKGVASSAFDTAWKQLAKTQNKAFGTAQQQFLEIDKKDTAAAFFDRANIAPNVRSNPELFDLALGTSNQFDSLAEGMADHLATLQKKAGRSFTAKEVGVALSNYKLEHITSLFKSSPDAWAGVKARFKAERAIFQ